MARPWPDRDDSKTPLKRWRTAAWLILWLEGMWPHLVALSALGAAFVALALINVLPRLPGGVHAGILALFALVAVRLLIKMVRHWPRPLAEQAARRLEADSALAHRPLATLADHPVAANALGQALWREHCRRTAQTLVAPRLSFPRSDMAERDPFGWRAAALLALVIALAGGHHDGWARLDAALRAEIAVPVLGPDQIDVWITPPAYTGAAPLALHPGQEVTIPTGSRILAVTNAGWGSSTLSLSDEHIEFVGSGDNGQRAEMVAHQSGPLAITHWGTTLASWPVTVVADALPSIDFAEPPQAGERGRLKISVTASDDYGLDRLWVDIARAGLDEGSTPLHVDLPMGSGTPRSLDLVSWHDLSAHPWAGLPVTLRPRAQDGQGQTSGGEWVSMVLPERSFTHPGAQAVIEQRRRLTQPNVRILTVMQALDTISGDRALFGDDLLTFLALRTARHALADEDYDAADIQDLLWNAALRIEDGDLAGAERNLEQARHALEQAIRSGETGERLAELVDALEAALDRWMQAMAAKDPQGLPDGLSSDQVIDGEDLANVMDQLRDLARTGARDALAQMLQDLTDVLQSAQRGGGSGPDPAALARLADLQALAKDQQTLTEDGHRHVLASPPPAGKEAAKAQSALERRLRDLIGRMPQSAQSPNAALDQAGESMRSAADALGRDDWAEAQRLQAQALEQLREILRDQARQMAGGIGSPRRDPLGRPLPGPDDDGTTRLPSQSEHRQSQDLLEELRRRAGDGQRPELERDYLNRLLRQF